MASIGSVVVQFIGKDKLSGVARTVGKAVGGVEGKTTKATGAFGKLSGAWAASIPIAGAVIAGGIGIANVLLDAAKAATEDKKSADKLAIALSSLDGVTDAAIAANEDWITGMQLATNVADTDLRVAVGKLALATGSLTKAQQLTKIAVDASAGSGKKLSTVTDALAKATTGNTSSLKRLYPWLDKNKDGTVTLDEAQRGLKKAFQGSAAEAAKTDVWTTLNTIMGELQESIGLTLLPILEDFAAWFRKKDNQQKVQDFIDKIADLATAVGDDAAEELKDLIAWLKKPANQQQMRNWATLAGKIATAMKHAADAVAVLMKMLETSPVGLISKLLNSGSGGSAGSWSATPTRSSRAAAAPPAAAAPAPTILVTEEQVYRAVQRLMLRGQARNGHALRVG